jgi:hypothetical protein
MPRPTRETGQIIRAGEVASSSRRENRAGSEPREKINDIQSRNMYENKQKDDNLSPAKGENFA